MIVVVDYGMGNVGSIVNMLKKVGTDSVVSSDASVIASAEKIVLPGVGSFDNGMMNLEERCLIPTLNEKVLKEKVPILGVCLGMQLFTRRSEEGRLAGFGWLDAETVRFRFGSDNAHLKIPHMGWNAVTVTKANPLINNMRCEQRFYFVHSYHVVCNETQDVLAMTHHGYAVTAAISRDNMYGVQFHPEKSHHFGMMLMKKFVEL